jgi:Na+/H+-dicarboxylate symporter
MKIWMKYLLGAILGLIVALVLPIDDAGLRGILSFLFELSIRIGRYILLPLVLFSVPVAVFELNEDGEFWRSLGRSLVVLVAGVAALTLVGIVVAAIVHPARIPLEGDAAGTITAIGFRELFLAVFPESPFAVLASGQFLLPVFVLSILLGLAFSHDRPATKPVLILFDSLSRIFYQINSFFVEFLGVLVIAVTAFGVLSLRSMPRPEIFRPLLTTVAIEVLAVAFIVIPAFVWFFGGRKSPWKILYGLLAPSIAALVSGDVYFPFGVLAKHSKESLGIRRRDNMLSLPLAFIFGRAGTALVTSTSFIVVLSSYSNLGVTFGNFLTILVAVPLVTLLLGASPGRGALSALVSLCALYGKGFENGYLIVAPVALPLVAAGAFLDTLWAGCAALVLARKSGHVQEKESRFHI